MPHLKTNPARNAGDSSPSNAPKVLNEVMTPRKPPIPRPSGRVRRRTNPNKGGY